MTDINKTYLFVNIRSEFGSTTPLKIADTYKVDDVKLIAGRTNTILFCTNVVTGEKREISSAVAYEISERSVYNLLCIERDRLRSLVENINDRLSYIMR